MASIKKEKNGTYTLRWYVKDPITGKNKEKKQRGFRTKSEATEAERKLPKKGSDVLFYTLFEEFLDTKEWKEETKQDTERLLKRYIPDVETLAYKNIDKPYLKALRRNISKLDLSAVRKNKIIDTIKKVCRYAHEVYDLDNYSDSIERFKDPHYKFEIWNLEDYQKFEKVALEECPEYAAFYRLLYFSGLRRGEAKALTVDSLDIETSTISVEHGMRLTASSLGDTKNPQSVRKIKIDEYTLNMLKPLKSHEKWLFGDYKPFANTTIKRNFDKCAVLAGVPRIRIHDLRHSHISYLLGNGIDVVSVASRAGHSSISTTLNTYSHILNNSEDKVINLLNTASLRPQANEKPLK